MAWQRWRRRLLGRYSSELSECAGRAARRAEGGSAVAAKAGVANYTFQTARLLTYPLALPLLCFLPGPSAVL